MGEVVTGAIAYLWTRDQLFYLSLLYSRICRKSLTLHSVICLFKTAHQINCTTSASTLPLKSLVLTGDLSSAALALAFPLSSHSPFSAFFLCDDSISKPDIHSTPHESLGTLVSPLANFLASLLTTCIFSSHHTAREKVVQLLCGSSLSALHHLLEWQRRRKQILYSLRLFILLLSSLSKHYSECSVEKSDLMSILRCTSFRPVAVPREFFPHLSLSLYPRILYRGAFDFTHLLFQLVHLECTQAFHSNETK